VIDGDVLGISRWDCGSGDTKRRSTRDHHAKDENHAHMKSGVRYWIRFKEEEVM